MPKKNAPYRKSVIEKLRLEWYEMDLTNKILLLLGIVLLFELIFSIFMRSVNTDLTTDTFFRITFSSVMGYFLGGMNTTTPPLEKENTPTVSPLDNSLEPLLPEEQDFEHLTSIRTLFVAFVCLACIITLSVTTFSSQTDYAEGLIQLRNIISTTIGFLISKANRRR